MRRILITTLLATAACGDSGDTPPATAHIVGTLDTDGCELRIDDFEVTVINGDTNEPNVEEFAGFDCAPMTEDGDFWELVCVATDGLGETWEHRLPKSGTAGTSRMRFDDPSCVSVYVTVVTVGE